MKSIRFCAFKSFIHNNELNIQTGPFGTQLKASDYVSKGIPVINVRNIGYRVEKEGAFEYLNDKVGDKLKQHKLEEGDIVFGRKGAVDRHLLIGKRQKGWIQGSDCIRIRFTSNKVNQSFLSYFFLTNGHKRWMEAQGSFGATMGSLNQGIIQRIEYPDFPLPIQRKIAAVLSAYDDLIENNSHRVAILEKTAEELYREWFVRLRFPGHEKTKIVKGVPEGWEIVKVGDLISRISVGKRYENRTILPEGKVPVLDQGQSGVIGYHNEEPGVQASIDSPVITFANHTCYQRLVFNPFSTIQNVLPFKSNSTLPSDIYWLHYATKDLIEFSDYKGHWPEFINKCLYYPGEKITIRYGVAVKPIIQETVHWQHANSVLKDTRDRLLSRLMSGKIDLEDLDIQFPKSMEA